MAWRELSRLAATVERVHATYRGRLLVDELLRHERRRHTMGKRPFPPGSLEILARADRIMAGSR